MKYALVLLAGLMAGSVGTAGAAYGSDLDDVVEAIESLESTIKSELFTQNILLAAILKEERRR